MADPVEPPAPRRLLPRYRRHCPRLPPCGWHPAPTWLHAAPATARCPSSHQRRREIYVRAPADSPPKPRHNHWHGTACGKAHRAYRRCPPQNHHRENTPARALCPALRHAWRTGARAWRCRRAVEAPNPAPAQAQAAQAPARNYPRRMLRAPIRWAVAACLAASCGSHHAKNCAHAASGATTPGGQRPQTDLRHGVRLRPWLSLPPANTAAIRSQH